MSPSARETGAPSAAQPASTVELLRSGALEVEVPASVWAERFDAVYREASGDRGRVPWSHRKPNPAMVNWMNAEAHCHLRPGARIAVVGCGLGEDAVFLADRGYDVCAFDISGAAIEWARRLHPQHAEMFCTADLLDLPANLLHRFDLAVEVHTLQAFPPSFRGSIARGIADLLTHGGLVLACARGRPDDVPLDQVTGPPFALTPAELSEAMSEAGLEPVGEVVSFEDDNDPPVLRLRAVHRRGGR